jgi:hypothetical protein
MGFPPLRLLGWSGIISHRIRGNHDGGAKSPATPPDLKGGGFVVEFYRDRLKFILEATTIKLRKGEDVQNPEEIKLDAKLPSHLTITDPKIEKIDVGYLIVGVYRNKVEEFRDELIEILDAYPGSTPLKDGPSCILVGGELQDVVSALQLFALGKFLGFWEIVGPATFGFKGQDADAMLASGFLLISGYKPISSSGK